MVATFKRESDSDSFFRELGDQQLASRSLRRSVGSTGKSNEIVGIFEFEVVHKEG